MDAINYGCHGNSCKGVTCNVYDKERHQISRARSSQRCRTDIRPFHTVGRLFRSIKIMKHLQSLTTIRATSSKNTTSRSNRQQLIILLLFYPLWMTSGWRDDKISRDNLMTKCLFYKYRNLASCHSCKHTRFRRPHVPQHARAHLALWLAWYMPSLYVLIWDLLCLTMPSMPYLRFDVFFDLFPFKNFISRSHVNWHTAEQ